MEDRWLGGKRELTDEDWEAYYYEIPELFSPGSPINEVDLLAGRHTEIRRLTETVVQRGKHAVVFGERGVGKTSLVNTFHKRIISRLNRISAFRVQCHKNDNFTAIWRKVFRRLELETNGRRSALAEEYPDEITPDDVLIELSNFSLNKLPIITIDEFDRVKDEEAKTLIADTIKSISDEGFDITLVIVGVAESVSDLILEHQSISRALVQIQMPRMSVFELKDIVSTRLNRTPLSISDDALWEIAILSRGLPWYTHSLGRFAARRAIGARVLEIDGKHVERAIKDCLVDVDQTTKECYVHATTSSKSNNIYEEVLLACALTDCDELGRFTMKQVEDPLFIITQTDYKSSAFAFHMNEFCKEDHGPVLEKLKRKSQVMYRFVDPLMQPYVVLRGLDAGLITREDTERFMTQHQPRFSIGF